MAANTHSSDLESDSSQYVDRADTASLSITGDLSIAVWVNRESDGSQAVFTKWKTQGNEKSYLFHFDASDNLELFLSDDGSTNTSSSQSTGTVKAADGWVHVAVTYDASAGTTAFYIDGSASGTGSSQANSIHDNASRPAIGTRFDSGGAATSFYDGLIDEVVVTSDILTSGEISKLFQGFDASLIGLDNLAAYYKLNNDYTDESANSNDMSATGSPVFSTTVPFANYATAGGRLDLTSKTW